MSTSDKSMGLSQGTHQPPGGVTRARRGQSGRSSLFGLLGGLLAALLTLLMVGCGSADVPPMGGLVVVPTPTNATATAGPTSNFKLPYLDSAPGCGATASQWILQTAGGVSCLSNPERLRLTGESYTSAYCCENEIELPFGPTSHLSSTFRATVDISGLLGQTHAQNEDVITRLVVRLEPDTDLTGASPVLFAGFDIGGDGSATYTLGLGGPNTSGALDTSTFARPLSVAITVDAYKAAVAINGATYFQRPIATPVTVTGIGLQVVGETGVSAEFSNLKVELVTGGSPAVS